MIHRKIQSALLCVSLSGILLPLIYPLHYMETQPLYYPPNIALNIMIYNFFIPVGLAIIGVPLALFVEKLIIRLNLKNKIIISIFTLVLYLFIPNIILSVFSGQKDTIGIQLILSLVAIVYFIIDRGIMANTYQSENFQKTIKKLTGYVIFILLIFIILSILLIGFSF